LHTVNRNNSGLFATHYSRAYSGERVLWDESTGLLWDLKKVPIHFKISQHLKKIYFVFIVNLVAYVTCLCKLRLVTLKMQEELRQKRAELLYLLLCLGNSGDIPDSLIQYFDI
jgi:hypothetical protein